ncbi:microsomal glutathione S-transferase 1-like [Trichomycterus rosablanca]|uniref:microsomal glutathione S-transferase 1-like n=1 Tax=Trichomycterus rosablanca TaxID=2290929 RepID=UPI002F360A62
MAQPIESDVFMAFCTYATIAILKMMLMAPLTAYFRVTRKAFANPEDTNLGKTPEEKKKMHRVDEDVERVRRCHLNHLENIVPFVMVGLLYALTGPNLSSALMHFRIFVASRLVYTVAYINAMPHPLRGLAWMVGMGVIFSMAFRILTTSLLL